jgi:flagellar basal-body rod protein FlgF
MDGIDWAGSAMIAARTRLDIATGNLANVSTNGFEKVVARGALTAHGVEIARSGTSERGMLQRTQRPYDLAIVGTGTFRVRDGAGRVSSTRNGAFTRDRDGCLRDDGGRTLLGLHGPLRVPAGATIDERGRVLMGGTRIDRIPLHDGARLRTGYLETANVDAISEMVDVMTAQRSFESAEKVVAAIDSARRKSSNDVARIK